MPTIVEQERMRGFQSNLYYRGRAVTADTLAVNGKPEAFTVMVQDQPEIADPDKPLQAQRPVFTRLAAMVGCVKDPRAMQRITETASGRIHKVLRFEETSGDLVSWVWTCEAQRQ